MRRIVVSVLLAAAALSGLAGCSSDGARKADYKKATTLPPLEVPPDLTAPAGEGSLAMPEVSSITFSDSAARAETRSAVLPEYDNVKVLGDRDQRWLVLDAPPDVVWKSVKAFWEQNGFELRLVEPALGIMETQWAENRADVPQGAIRSFLSKALDSLYSASTRDKFRVRLEAGARPDTTELFLTHYGVEEVYAGGETGNERGYWQGRPSDPELVNEMLKRLVVYLGVREEAAGRMVAEADEVVRRARLESRNGAPAVLVEEGFPRAWRRTGIGLERIGLVVEDRDRSKGIYFVRGLDAVADAGGKKRSGLFGWFGSDDEEQAALKATVLVEPVGERTVVYVADAQGNGRDPSERAQKLLQQLALELQ